MIQRMATLLGGAVTGQLVTVLAAFILTRLYSPSAFAHLEMFALVTGIAAVLGTGKFEQALMLPKDMAKAKALFSAGQRAVAKTTLLVGLLSLLTANLVAETYDLEGWFWLACVLPLFAGVAAHTRLLEYWHHRNTEAIPVASANATGPLAAEATKLGLSSAWSTTGLVWGSGAGLLVRWAMMRRGLSAHIGAAWSWKWPAGDAAVREEYKDYPTWVLAGSAMNRLAQWLHVLLIGASLGPVLLGMMGLARRMVMQPLSLLATSAAPVLFQSATEKADGAPLRRLFVTALLTFATGSVVVWGAVTLAPDGTTAWLFGEEWYGAMEVVRMLTPWFVLNFMTAGLGSMFHRVRKPRWITYLDALHLLAVAAGWYLGSLHPEWFGGGEWGALVGIVWAKCGYYIINLVVLCTAVMQPRRADR